MRMEVLFGVDLSRFGVYSQMQFRGWVVVLFVGEQALRGVYGERGEGFMEREERVCGCFYYGFFGFIFFRQQDGLLRGGYEVQELLCLVVFFRKVVFGISFIYINEDFRIELFFSLSSDIEDVREQRVRNVYFRGFLSKFIFVFGKLEKVRISVFFGVWVELGVFWRSWNLEVNLEENMWVLELLDLGFNFSFVSFWLYGFSKVI